MCVWFLLKGLCHEIFDIRFFHVSISPMPQSIPLGPFQICLNICGYFRSSRCRWHRWQMKKIFNQKSLNYFVWTPLSSRVNLKIIVFLQAHFLQYPQYDNVPIFATGVVDTGGEFADSIDDTGGKFANSINNTSVTGSKICRWCHWFQWCTFTCKYLREFLKKFEMSLLLFTGAWGKNSWIHEKNLKQKISWHCPFKVLMSHENNPLLAALYYSILWYCWCWCHLKLHGILGYVDMLL